MDNRNLDINSLAVLRKKAVEAIVVHNSSIKTASKLFGFSAISLKKYLNEYNINKEKSYEYNKRGVAPGTGTKISESQMQDLKSKILSTTPDTMGMNYTLWNSKVLREYVEQKYQQKYNPRSIRKIMTKLGFSSQKPVKKAIQQDPEKVKKWLEVMYPEIKKRAIEEKARIYWGDEMGIQSTDNRGSTYGAKGKTPEIKRSAVRFKCNMLAAISPEGVMNWMVFEDNFESKKFIAFMGRLIRQVKQKIFLIVYNHKVHHCKKVTEYVKKRKGKIELFFLPPYSPELNPQELVNQDVKKNANNFKALTSMKNLAINVRLYLTRIQFNEWKIMKFFKEEHVAYAQ